MDSRLFVNKELWQLWTYCLMKANHKKCWFSVVTGKGQTEIEIKPGSFVFGRNTWARKLKSKPSTLWNQMKKLKDLGFLDIQSNNTCSVVTIVNWKIYQGRENEVEQVNGQPVVNDLKGNCKPSANDLTQSNNVKNDKNVDNDKKKEAPFVLPDWIPADLWKEFLKVQKKAKTDYAKNIAVKKLERMKAEGHDIVQALENSIEAGWSRVFEPKNNNRPESTDELSKDDKDEITRKLAFK